MGHLVFVYGTLLQGERNHRLLAHAEPLGPHRTEPAFTLLDLGAYPGAIRGGATAIVGELYGLPSRGLWRLDRLERYPILFERIRIQAPGGQAWIYLFRGRARGHPVLGSGDWRDRGSDRGRDHAHWDRAPKAS